MAVISIRKFLTQDSDAEQALLHVVSLLVEGIDKHVTGNSEECVRFRETVRHFSAALDEKISCADLLVQAGAVVKGLDEYDHFAAKQKSLQTAELRHMVTMLTATVKAVTASNSAQVSALGDIEHRIVTASELDDVRLMKSRLGDCLTEIRKETERRQKEADETIERLNQGLTDARQRIGAALSEAQDRVTGLPGRPVAEAALARVGQEGSQVYAAIMVLDRLQALNARFGREVGDEVLASFTSLVQTNLRAEDTLFRWGGPTLLALMPRTDIIDMVRSEVSRIMAIKLEHTVQMASRSLLVPISARWTVIPVMAAVRLTCQKIDTFAAAPSLRG